MSFKAHVERLRGAPAPKRVIKTTWSRFPAKVSHSMNVSEREGERERGRERERERGRERVERRRVYARGMWPDAYVGGC